LGTGEHVESGVVIGPDAEWAERLEELLWHKGDPWNWQNQKALRKELGIGVRFYILHRGGKPFANIMLAERCEVGLLGHVWTRPEDRRKGACSKLMGVQMEDFRSRQGKALFLETEFDSGAYRIYERFGFRSVEPKSGYMDWYAKSRERFEAAYFKRGETEIQVLGWRHWPSSAALFMGDFPCILRCAPLKLIGRRLTETPFLPLLRDGERRQEAGLKSRAVALYNQATTAVVGFAAWDWHPLWEDTCLVDVFCHPDYWDEAGNLFKNLSLPDGARYIAYSDIDCNHKARVLLEAGFERTAVLKKRVPGTMAKTSFLDVELFEKTSGNISGR
jgi:hypothetical protein